MRVEFTAKVDLPRPLRLDGLLAAVGHIHRISRGQGVPEDAVRVKTYEGYQTESTDRPPYVEAEWVLDTEDGDGH